MSDHTDFKHLRGVIRQAVRASRQFTRDLETAMGLGHGRLEGLLDGSVEIRLQHLLGLARLLEVPPGDFLELGCPDATGSAKHRLTDWIGPVEPPFKKKKAAAAAAPAVREELETLVREAVRRELAERGGTGGNGGGG